MKQNDLTAIGRAIVMNLWNNLCKAEGVMRSGAYRCCLCVAQDTAEHFGYDSFMSGKGLPHVSLGEFLSIENNCYSGQSFNPILFKIGESKIDASGCNDGSTSCMKLSHKQIAILFCDKFPGLESLKESLQKKLALLEQ